MQKANKVSELSMVCREMLDVANYSLPGVLQDYKEVCSTVVVSPAFAGDQSGLLMIFAGFLDRVIISEIRD